MCVDNKRSNENASGDYRPIKCALYLSRSQLTLRILGTLRESSTQLQTRRPVTDGLDTADI